MQFEIALNVIPCLSLRIYQNITFIYIYPQFLYESFHIHYIISFLITLIAFSSNVFLLMFQAVAFGARFIKLGGPVRAEHVSKYRRLQQIEQELEQRGRLTAQEQHVFPVINVVEQEQEAEESEQN